MLRCQECDATSEDGKGWRSYLAQDPDEDDYALTVNYCPECAEREFEGLPPDLKP